MLTLSEVNRPESSADEEEGGGATDRRPRRRHRRKALAALLAAGLVVPKLEASFRLDNGVDSAVAAIERDYASLVKDFSRLSSIPSAAPTFKTLLFLEKATDRLLPGVAATLPGSRFTDGPHGYLLVENDFLDFLTKKDNLGRPLLSSSDAVRTYGAALVASRVFQVPPNLLICLLLQESRMRSSAVSPTGAEGAGQLTAVALAQVDELLNQSSRWRERLRLYETTMNQLYGDSTTRGVLDALIPDMRYPVLTRINRVERSPVSDGLLRRVALVLDRKHPELAKDAELLRTVCTELRAGRAIEPNYAPIATAYGIASTELYNAQLGNTFNPESNVAFSAMLFRHYIRYPWTLDGRRLVLPYSLRCALAVIAYNQGPLATLRILKHISETGLFDVDAMSIQTMLQLYSEELVVEAIGEEPGMRAEELYRHFDAIMSCAIATDHLPMAPRIVARVSLPATASAHRME